MVRGATWYSAQATRRKQSIVAPRVARRFVYGIARYFLTRPALGLVLGYCG
jgi:hypothetical protein